LILVRGSFAVVLREQITTHRNGRGSSPVRGNADWRFIFREGRAGPAVPSYPQHVQPFFRRGRCFADTARMMSWPRPPAGSGALDWATAAFITACTAGRFR